MPDNTALMVQALMGKQQPPPMPLPSYQPAPPVSMPANYNDAWQNQLNQLTSPQGFTHANMQKSHDFFSKLHPQGLFPQPRV